MKLQISHPPTFQTGLHLFFSNAHGLRSPMHWHYRIPTKTLGRGVPRGGNLCRIAKVSSAMIFMGNFSCFLDGGGGVEEVNAMNDFYTMCNY